MYPSEELEEKGGISIGALARATGISIHSLRMWERRYGAPTSYRRASGHRRYPQDEVDRLRAVARALAAGFRASEVVHATIPDIDRLLAEADRHARKHRRGDHPVIETNRSIIDKVEEWIDATQAYDEHFLTNEFHDAWVSLGPLRFMTDRATPFIKAIGEAWQCGHLPVSQEHFAIERLADFLSAKWRRLNERALGAPLILATLPKDQHRMGLLMCAALTATNERRVIYLGPGVPIEDIAEAALATEARAVCISISSCSPARYAAACLKALRETLPTAIDIVSGGTGAPTNVGGGVLYFRDLIQFNEWIRDQREAEGVF